MQITALSLKSTNAIKEMFSLNAFIFYIFLYYILFLYFFVLLWNLRRFNLTMNLPQSTSFIILQWTSPVFFRQLNHPLPFFFFENTSVVKPEKAL